MEIPKKLVSVHWSVSFRCYQKYSISINLIAFYHKVVTIVKTMSKISGMRNMLKDWLNQQLNKLEGDVG